MGSLKSFNFSNRNGSYFFIQKLPHSCLEQITQVVFRIIIVVIKLIVGISTFARTYSVNGNVAEWLRRGLQNPVIAIF